MKAQVSLKMGLNSKHIARALMDEAKDGLPKVEVEVIPAGEKVKIEIEAEDFIWDHLMVFIIILAPTARVFPDVTFLRHVGNSEVGGDLMCAH